MKKKEEKPLYEQQAMPHDLDTENMVLATLIRYSERFQMYSDLLSAELFYYNREKAIYKCIEGVISTKGMTDVNSLYAWSKSHDVDYQIERYDFVNIIQLVNGEALESGIRRLRDMARRRLCWKMLMQSSVRVLDLTTELDDEMNAIISSVGEVQSSMGDEEIADFYDAITEVHSVAVENLNGNNQYLTTGFKLFDEQYLLRPGTFTVIAAFPAVGKSALALNIAVEVAKRGIPSAYYSLEMGKSELASRAISEQLGLPAYVIMNKPLSQSKMGELQQVAENNKYLPIYFDDRSTVSFDRVIRSIRTLVKTKHIKLAFIDYLQIFNQITDDEESGLSYMARMCKNVAKETGIAIVALSQLNRNSGGHPSLRNLRGSGQIEESADNVVLIDRPEAYPDSKVKTYEDEYKDASIKGTAKLILSKVRGGHIGCSLVAFDGKYTKFSEIKKPEPAGNYQEQTDDLPF